MHQEEIKCIKGKQKCEGVKKKKDYGRKIKGKRANEEH